MTANHIRNIAIVGAAGQLGKFIVAALLSKNAFNITAITRNGSPTPPAGVNVATVDYDEPDTIVAALEGQDALIITMSIMAPPEQQAKLIQAAAKAGVPWVLPNEFGGDTNNIAVGNDTGIGAPKKKTRELIENLGVSSWIAVATGFWYEYSLAGPSLYGIDINKREVVFFDEGKERINTSTWPQVGRAIANLLALPVHPKDENDKSVTLSWYRNRFVFVSSFTLNQREMLDSVERVTGTTDADWKISNVSSKERFEESKSRMANGERIGFAHALYTRYFFPGEKAALYEVTRGLANENLGLPKEDLDEFTKEAVRLAESGYFTNMFT